jgi:predicted lipid-binding transport protein (Tim44 family)
LFPAVPSALMVTGLTGGLMVGAACFAAFAGILTDPLQRRLGLHTRRLHRMLDALERQMLDPAAPGYVVHDHYAARLMDLIDLLGSAYRLAHG